MSEEDRGKVFVIVIYKLKKMFKEYLWVIIDLREIFTVICSK